MSWTMIDYLNVLICSDIDQAVLEMIKVHFSEQGKSAESVKKMPVPRKLKADECMCIDGNNPNC